MAQLTRESLPDNLTAQGIDALDPSIPLIVDLDGTLLLTDSLHESFIAVLFRWPHRGAAGLLTGFRNRAAAKRYLGERHTLDVANLPVRADLLDLLRTERARGRAVHLVTAADQSIADRVLREFDVFVSATGSDGQRNLKGDAKLDYIREQFPSGFIYAGDSFADLPIFRASRGAILCDLDESVGRELVAAGTPVLAQYKSPQHLASQWLKAARPHQWSKNILVFIPLITGHALFDLKKLTAVILGFVVLCVLASATYIINDLADLDSDRRHPTKRYRPFASGQLPVSAGLIVAALMITGVLAFSIFAMPLMFALTALGYLALTVLYSAWLKRIPLFDVFVIGLLFTFRIVMGIAASDLNQSPWLLAFSVIFFFSLALAKRHVELIRALNAGQSDVPGRGYRADDWPLTLVFGVGAALVSIVIMLLYLTNDAAPSGFYRQIAWLYVAPMATTLWVLRIWLLSHRAVLDDDPVLFALRDPSSWALGALVAAAIALAL